MKSSIYSILLIILFTSLSFFAKGTKVDSLKSPKIWLQEQNSIGQYLLKNNHEFDKAVQIFESAHRFAETQNLLSQFPEISIGYGIALYKNGDIQNSYAILHDIHPIIENSDPKLKAEVNKILGMTLVFKNKFPEGYKFQMEALKYYSDINDSTGMMDIYYDLGANFGTQGQDELALKNYEKGIAIAKSLNDTKMTILGITAIGGTWASLNDYEKALSYSDESIELAKKLIDDEELAWASINRGHLLIKMKKNKEAEFHLQQAYDLSFKIGNKLLTAYALEQMSDLKRNQNQLELAINKLDESYQIFLDLGQTNSVKNVTKKYAEIYYKQKNYSKYKEYNDKYISLKDSLYSKEMLESMANLKQDYEIHKLERENHIALLTKDQELDKAKNHTHLVSTCGLLITFLLLLILMYSRNRSAFEKNELLKAKNAEILRQNEFLANSNRDLEKFAYIISHDLKEPLRNINGFTKLLSRKLKQYFIDEDINEYTEFIINGTQQMEELLTGLLEYSKISVNQSEKQIVNLNNIASKVINNLKIQLNEKNCEVQLRPLPNIACRPTHLSQVFQNLIANAIKFGRSEGNNITIGVEERENDFKFFVRDQGIGIDPDYQKDIFVVFKRLHNRGTYSGSGIGLATCSKIVEDHGGKIWVESIQGEGSCFFFTLPKNTIDQNNIPVSKIIDKKEPEFEMV